MERSNTGSKDCHYARDDMISTSVPLTIAEIPWLNVASQSLPVLIE
jgi:hypothetical protein